MSPGDPSPRSPAEVMQDPMYRMLEVRPVGMSVVLTVLHCGSETLWQTVYCPLYDTFPAEWYPVKRQVVQKTEYVRT